MSSKKMALQITITVMAGRETTTVVVAVVVGHHQCQEGNLWEWVASTGTLRGCSVVAAAVITIVWAIKILWFQVVLTHPFNIDTSSDTHSQY